MPEPVLADEERHGVVFFGRQVLEEALRREERDAVLARRAAEDDADARLRLHAGRRHGVTDRHEPRPIRFPPAAESRHEVRSIAAGRRVHPHDGGRAAPAPAREREVDDVHAFSPEERPDAPDDARACRGS